MCNNISASYMRVVNEYMIMICFGTIVKDNLPHFSYILRNPEPLGIEFKIVAFSVTGESILI